MKRLYRAASRAISRCLSFSPIPLLSEASLSLLRVALTHFVLSSYERALRLPTFSISGLTRLGVKPRFYRSLWRAFASTHPLTFPSISPWEAFLACPPSPHWNLPFLPCYRFDPPLSRQGAALAHFDSIPPYDLVLCTDGSVPFPFGKGGSGVLATCSLCGTEAILSFLTSPISSVFPLKPAPFCKLFAGLCRTKKPI